jgi:hypothetical protein
VDNGKFLGPLAVADLARLIGRTRARPALRVLLPSARRHRHRECPPNPLPPIMYIACFHRGTSKQTAGQLVATTAAPDPVAQPRFS